MLRRLADGSDERSSAVSEPLERRASAMATPPSGPMPFDERPSHTRVVDWRSRCATQKAPWSSSRLSPSSSSHGCAPAPAASSPSTSVCAAVAPSAAARSSSRSRRLPAAMICWKRLSRSSVGMRSRSSHRASKSRAESSSSAEEELRFAEAERARCDGRSAAALLAGRSAAAGEPGGCGGAERGGAAHAGTVVGGAERGGAADAGTVVVEVHHRWALASRGGGRPGDGPRRRTVRKTSDATTVRAPAACAPPVVYYTLLT